MSCLCRVFCAPSMVSVLWAAVLLLVCSSDGRPAGPDFTASMMDPSLGVLPDFYGSQGGRRPGVISHQLPAAGGPPKWPANFKTVDELHEYLEDLRDYYAVLGRPRFGRSVRSNKDNVRHLKGLQNTKRNNKLQNKSHR